MVSVFDAGPILPAPCILNSRGLGRRPQTNHTFQVPNTAEGHRALLARLTGLAPALVVLEASGGYEAAVAGVLYEAGLPVVVVNPRRVRGVCPGARPTGQNRPDRRDGRSRLWPGPESAGAPAAAAASYHTQCDATRPKSMESNPTNPLTAKTVAFLRGKGGHN